jgi:hypothetical protein
MRYPLACFNQNKDVLFRKVLPISTDKKITDFVLWFFREMKADPGERIFSVLNRWQPLPIYHATKAIVFECCLNGLNLSDIQRALLLVQGEDFMKHNTKYRAK